MRAVRIAISSKRQPQVHLPQSREESSCVLAAFGVFLAVALALWIPSGGSLGAPAPAPAPSRPALGYVPDEVIVKFRDDVDVNPQVFARSIGAVVHKSVSHTRGTPQRAHLLKVPAGTVEDTVQRLSRHPLVEFAEANRYVHAVGIPNDPRFGEQWALNNTGQNGGTVDADIDAPEAWDVTLCNPAVVIGILDTGIDQDHPDISPTITLNLLYTSFSLTVDDLFGHGTHVAGIAAAVTNNGAGVAGVGRGCSVANIKVLGDDGSGSVFDVAVGIYGCALVAHVCNMSLGSPSSSFLLEYYVNVAWNLGAVLVAAAGNNGSSSKFYPCAYTRVICVGSTNNTDGKSSFSNFGKTWVDVGAPGGERTVPGVILPGEGILSTIPNHPSVLFPNPNPNLNGESYGDLRGTSMASPHVAGVAALVRSSLCSTNSCVRSRIENCADKKLTNFFAKGRVNAYRSVGPCS